MITRRKLLGLAAASAAAASITACQRRPGFLDGFFPSGSKKKGLGLTTKNPEWAKRLSALRCKWFYSWNSAIPEGVPRGVEFIPMIYRYGGDPKKISEPAAAAKKAGITELLGFNEPEEKKQGNMTMQEVLDAWPLLMETGMRLGSPNCVHPDKEFMTEFMSEAKKRGLRVDFVCVHSYGGPNAKALVERLEKIHQMYDGRPIWITEFAVGDWEAKAVEQNRHKPETVQRFMQEALPMLDKLDFVERYAWFPAKPTGAPLGTSALFDEDGTLTRLGEVYRDA
jgi:hypothetical protein